MPRDVPRSRSLLWLAVAYAAAYVAAHATVRALPAVDPLWAAAAGDVVATLVVFGFSVALDNSSVYDPYWSVAPLALVPYWATEVSGGEPARGLLVCLLVAIWGLRLTHNFLRGWSGLGHEDFRYVDFRRTTGRAYWLVSLLGIHLFPTMQVFLGCLAALAAVRSARPLGALDALAAAVTLGAIVVEGVADDQLRAFVTRPDPRPGEICERGLWAYSRHPNYFGEIAFWWGLVLFAVAAGDPPWWAFVGASSITAMFVLVSLPLIEKRARARRPGFEDYASRVSALVPWFPRR